MSRALVLALLAAGCSSDPCDEFKQDECVSVTVRAPNLEVDQLHILTPGTKNGGANDAFRPESPSTLHFPVAFAVFPPASFLGTYAITVEGLGLGRPVGADSGSVKFEDGGALHQKLELTLAPTGGGGDGGAPFDLAGADAGSVCDPVRQTGCPAGNTRCLANLVTQTLECDSPNGIGGVSDPCGNAGGPFTPAHDNCAPGNECIPVGAFGVCTNFCAQEGDCTQSFGALNKGHCIISINGLSVRLCTVACDPVSPTNISPGGGCPDGMTCRVFRQPGGLSEYTNCTQRGAGTPDDGADCSNGNDDVCADGFSCHPVSHKCRHACNSGNDADCVSVSGTTCRKPTGNVAFGFCCTSDTC